ncbi:ATP-dependent helicase/deoxyribonuclease subunit B [Botrimarina colliarenosi]|uniref:ATP-dependent helicase/deoxyribonuclease subunit B n=1 Tax=Botrimarina colliarenosi TaxID=2528001 RepID=A0A5C6A992_9BACT|nr:PD-(D/E)XK nuclease family protein [Botrimarina colliarenosi]TWT96006.1 ATP-dependent helicase/deoxyribonuclease subunit B [Botrimarina colliarenosi]
MPPRSIQAVAGSPVARRSALLRVIDEGPPAWWIVATPAAAAAVRREMASSGAAGRLAPGVMTLRQAANALTRLAERLPLGPAARSTLIGELAAAVKHRAGLGPLESLLESPGLVEFLGSRFRQLRRQGVGPEQAGSALRKLDGEEAGGAIARIYRDYLAAIDRDQLLDDEEALLVAMQQADRSNTPRRLILDLPLSITPIEEQLIAALAELADEVFVAVAGPTPDLPAAASLAGAVTLRERWLKTLRVDELSPSLATEDSLPPSGLERLRRGLFDDDSASHGGHEGVAIVAGGSAQDTARRVARRVKALLVSGVKPAEILVAAPQIDSAAPRYAEALREYGVPVSVDAADRLSVAPCVAAATALLEVVTSDWAFGPLVDFVSRSDLTAWSAPGPGEGFASVRAATEWLIRELQIPQRRGYVLHQIEQLAAREATTSTVRRLAEAARSASQALQTLADACDTLPDEATPLEWLDATDAVLRRLGHAGLRDGADAVNRQAGDALEEAAAAVESLARWRGREPRAVSLKDWAWLVRCWATRLRLSKRSDSEGTVRVVGLTTAIGLPCEHLLVVEAGESALAASDAEGADEAMLLFYELCATPSASLTFAYAALDDAAQPLFASPYLTDVERLFEPGALRGGEPPLLSVAVAEGEPHSRREARQAAVQRAVAGDAQGLATVAAAGDLSLVDALRSVDARARGDSFGPWEGALESDAAAAALKERFGTDHLWSASQLELMATCPFKFFSRQVLRMQPAGELTLGVDYRRRGLLMHDALAESLAELLAELPEGKRLSSEFAGRLTERIVDRINAAVESGKLPAHEAALARIEARQATEWAQNYADQQERFENDKRWSDAGVAMRPALFEARFGPGKSTEEPEDPHSVDQPLALSLPSGETLQVTGRIDRIDTAKMGDRTLFVVIDYKTAKQYTVKVEHIESGKQLQPVLYALAAQELLLDAGAIPVGAGYWVLQRNGFVAPAPKELPLVVFEDGVARPSDEWQATVGTVLRRCESLVGEIRSGDFPMLNDDEDCGKSCEFRTICRVGQTRALGKTKPAEAEGSS